MNFNLIFQSLKERKISASIFAISLILYVWLLANFLPLIKSLQLQSLLEAYPKAILNLMTGGANVNLFSPEGFFTLEFLALWGPIIVFGFAVAFATAIVAKEVDDGTMDFLLSQPIKRPSLIISRFFSLLIFLTAFSATTMVSMGFLAPLYDFTFKTEGLLATGLHLLLFITALSSVSLLLSLIFKERGQAVIFSVAFLISSHLLNALAEFNETLKELRFLSLFNYYNPYETLKNGTLPFKPTLIFLTVTAVCLILSLIIFKRKDIAT